MKTILLLAFLLINFSIKSQIDFSGTYAFQKKPQFNNQNKVKPPKDEQDTGPMGSLTLLKINGNEYKFWLSVNKGWPSYNMGDVEGIIFIENSKAIFTNKFEGNDSSCRIFFYLFDKYVKIEQQSSYFDCSFGHNVYVDGKYIKHDEKRITNLELENLYPSIEKYKVINEKAMLFADANASSSTKKYFVNGNIVIAITEKDDFIYTEFITPSGKFVFGWIKKTDLVLLNK